MPKFVKQADLFKGISVSFKLVSGDGENGTKSFIEITVTGTPKEGSREVVYVDGGIRLQTAFHPTHRIWYAEDSLEINVAYSILSPDGYGETRMMWEATLTRSQSEVPVRTASAKTEDEE